MYTLTKNKHTTTPVFQSIDIQKRLESLLLPLRLMIDDIPPPLTLHGVLNAQISLRMNSSNRVAYKWLAVTIFCIADTIESSQR